MKAMLFRSLIDEQPNDLLRIILGLLDKLSQIRALRVCKRWRVILIRMLSRAPLPTVTECIIHTDYYNYGRMRRASMPVNYSRYLYTLAHVAGDVVFKREFGPTICLDIRNIPLKAIIYGDLLGFKWMLGKKIFIVNKVNLLIHAIKCRKIDFVKYFILELDAPITQSTMVIAAKKSSDEIVKFLIEVMPDDPQMINNMVFAAAQSGHLSIIKILHEFGANVTSQFTFFSCISEGRFDITRFMIEVGGCDPFQQNNLALRLASMNNHTDIVIYLVSLGANISENNYAAIFNSIIFTNNTMFKTLIEHAGIVPEAVLGEIIHNLVSDGNIFMLRYLFDRGLKFVICEQTLSYCDGPIRYLIRQFFEDMQCIRPPT